MLQRTGEPMKKAYNLNHEAIYMSRIQCGAYQKIKIKAGRKTIYMDIQKNVSTVFIDLYDTDKKSKYGQDGIFFSADSDIIIDRNLIESRFIINEYLNLKDRLKNKGILNKLH